MKAEPLLDSELILNPDGSVYHLHLRPENIAETIITVGDPDRVGEVSKHFDVLEFSTAKREFVTHTGRIGNKRLTVLSTGIGTDNIDIVLNELDALVNIDLNTRQLKDELRSLDIIRIGTSGGLQAELGVDSMLVSEFAVGLDGLMNFYDTGAEYQPFVQGLMRHLEAEDKIVRPYMVKGSERLLGLFDAQFHRGITVTCTGFYGPQGRQLRLKPCIDDFIPKLQGYQFEGQQLTNFEMETAGIYGMGKALGHHCCSVNLIIANRATGQFSPDYQKATKHMIERTLEAILA